MRVMKSKSFYESFQENLKLEDALLESNKPTERKLKEDVAELTPTYEGRNSYYGKAFVETNGNKKTLTSYKTKIMDLEDGKITMLCDEDDLTSTTLRHIREFLKQNGVEPLTRKELVKLINGGELKESDENFEEYEDFSDGDIAKDVIDHFKEITGREIKEIFNYEDTGNDAEGYFKQDVIDETANAVIEYLEGKGLHRTRIDEILYKLDDELASIWEDYAPSDLSEQDEVYRIKSNENDREYSITDITELSQVSDGDVRPPIDISELLVDVDAKLTESYGENWGEINFQSTRFNNDTKDSNALFELNVGDKTYLMSMLLEENGTVLKVNNTKGQTIFKRKSNDIASLTESYIKQFIPKEEKEVPEVIKHMNQDLHDAYNFLNLQIDLGKKVPSGEKEAFNKYLQTQIYAFVAEVSDEIKANEPTEEDKLELPSFDKMVEEIFGKQWVKKEPEQKKLELDGVEELKEENYVKKYSNKLDTMSDKELYDAWKEVKDAPDEEGSQEEIEYTLASDALSEIEGELCRRGFMDENSNKTEKWNELTEGFDFSKYTDDELVDAYASIDDDIDAMFDEDNDKSFNTNMFNFIASDNGGAAKTRAIQAEVDKRGIDWDEFIDKVTAKTRGKINEADEVEEPKEETEKSEPVNGLGTGNASFARKPSNIEDVENKTKSFTSGDSSYLICKKEKLSKDEFDEIQNNLSQSNKYCREFKPLDTENYAFNVVELSCPDYKYKLLVDPSDSDYCKYVAKVGE